MISTLISHAIRSNEEVKRLKDSEDNTPIRKADGSGNENIKKPTEEPKKMPEKRPEVKEEPKKNEFIRWFADANKGSGLIVGGKGANLGEMYNLGIPVPPGFVVTAQAYDYYIEKAGIKEKIHELLSRIDYEDTEKLDQITLQIRTFIVESKFPDDLKSDIVEAYELLGSDKNLEKTNSALDILKASSEPIFVAVRSSATTEDLAEASFAGQQETYLNIKGNHDLLVSIKKCFASLFTSRATYYRQKKNFNHEQASLAVVVQKMINSDKSGVMFSKDPSYKNNNTIIEAVWGLGEGIVSGQITPDTYILNEDGSVKSTKVGIKKLAITRDSSGNQINVKLREERAKAQVLNNFELKKLFDFGIKLEEHYQKPQDIEFAIEDEEIYIVQTRPITTIEKRVSHGEEKEIQGEPIISGIPASPGIASGKVKIVESMSDLERVKQGDVLVTEMTNPDMVVTMQRSAAIITNEGGLTAHAAIVSREMGIPCVVGTEEATIKLKDGDLVTVDGFSGKVYVGKVHDTIKKEIKPVETITKTKIKVIVDLPSFAERAAKTKLKQVGLTRIEGIIAESGKHPEYFLKSNKLEDYQEIIFRGVNGISNYFDEVYVRTSDIRSDEYSNLEGAPKDKEANPMLGLHGIRYSLIKKDILRAELKALQEVAKSGKKIGLLLPQVISVEEVRAVKTILDEENIKELKLGIMIETPAAVQIIKELCEEKIEFISFGTNDLTQYILAVDRGNEKVQHLYSELHPAIIKQLEYVIRVCKRYNVETGICGQAGSNKEMVNFLINTGIDSITTNADMANEIAELAAEIEQEILSGTDKEPRHYEMKKKEEEMKK